MHPFKIANKSNFQSGKRPMNGWTLALCSGDDVPCFLYIIHGTVFFNNSLDVNVLPPLRRNQRISLPKKKVRCFGEQNTISWTGNVTKIVIQPNWRYL